ncbi:prepilin-type N-terminal cleavage/methylation domain-containing protein [Candidatus Parcubacteria bacterium]|nr:prepilin-type N-terminal cleavage/methylation domain-containing protein [Candidatus Parcubacteria bacterium]
MSQKGFSLIEVAFSVAIITIGLISVISLFSANIKSEIESKNKLTAVYLANESIEIVRQQRDNNWFKTPPDPWMTGIPTGNVAVVPKDATDIRKGWDVVLAAVDSDERKVFLTNDDLYLNGATAAAGTGFERYLTINTEATGSIECAGFGAECMEVVSHVSFGGTQLAEVTAYFYDGWY